MLLRMTDVSRMKVTFSILPFFFEEVDNFFFQI